MISTKWMRKLRLACPIAASSSIVLSLITCVIIVKVKGIWTGGLSWPFFSDMGRDPPAYYVFCVGLSFAAVALVFTWLFNWNFHKTVLPKDAKGYRIIALICCIAGVIANPGLPILAFFDTSSYTKTHSDAAQWFFYMETIAVLLNSVVSYKLYKLARSSGYYEMGSSGGTKLDVRLHKRKKTLLIQVSFFAIFFVAFLIYIPIASIFAPSSSRLTIADCLEEGLGTTYCTSTMRLNDTETTLFDNRGIFAWAQTRAAAQLTCILMLVGYSTSFVTNDYSDSESSNTITPVLGR